MKKLLILPFLLLCLSVFSQQVKISTMPITTNKLGAYIPVLQGGANYRLLSDSLAFGRVDSVKTSNDTVYYWVGGTRIVAGKIVGPAETDPLFDSKFSGKSTTNLTEGSNLYWTNARFDTRFGLKSTTDLVEGTNLYWTNARGDARYPQMSSGYVNPAWITSLPYSKITGVPSFEAAINAPNTNGKYWNGYKQFVGLNTDSITEGSTNQFYTTAKFDTRFSTKTTDNLTQGSTNKYYSSTLFSNDFSAKSTSDLTEGTNLYWTNSRFDVRLATKTTDNLAEGSSNKYYTDARARAAITLTTIGTGAASYNTGTGVLNIPISAGGGGGSSTFVGLSDGPGVFTAHGLNYTRVNSGATALEYRTPANVLADIGGQAQLVSGTNIKTVNSNDAVVGAGNIRTRVEGYNTIADMSPNGYEGFPYVDTWNDNIFYAWKSSTTHAGSGPIMLARSRDGNKTIDSTWQLNVGGLIAGSNLSFGIIKTGSHAGRILIKWRDAAVSSLVEFGAYSDDSMKTWAGSNTLTYNINSSTFGRIRQISGDTTVEFRYSVGASFDTTYLNYTVDGVTWSAYDTVAMSATQSYNEADLQHLGNGKIIAIVRGEAPLNRPSQFTSTDNGHTWTRQGGLNTLNFSTNNTPTFVEKYDNKLWLLSNFRDGAGNNSVWWYSSGTEAQVFADTSKWAKRSAYYHPLNDDLGNATLGIENGYTVPFQFAGRLMVVGYDNSPTETVAVTAKVRAITIPILANGDFAKVYNDGNQSIANNTATLVNYTDIDLNDDLTFNTDSGFVIIRRDGWYTYKAVATYDLSGGGTYRQLYVYVTSAAYNAAAFLQPQILSQTTIPGNAVNSDFNRMECGGVYFFRKGEQVRIYTKQDSGGALNLVNTSPNTMATLIIKRIIN